MRIIISAQYIVLPKHTILVLENVVTFTCFSRWAWFVVRSDGSFEYQFLIDNTVHRYFKFTLLAMVIILQCRYFVSVLARDARYCKA